MLSSVDLPAPDGPIIAVNSPDLNLPLTDFKITFSSAKKKKQMDNKFCYQFLLTLSRTYSFSF